MAIAIGAAFIVMRFTSLNRPSANIGRECLSVIVFLFMMLGILVILGRYSIGPF